MFAYSEVVCKRILDIVPKQVHHFLVSSVCDGLRTWLLSKVTGTDIQVCFAENPMSKRKRSELELKLRQFKEGVELLSGIMTCFD